MLWFFINHAARSMGERRWAGLARRASDKVPLPCRPQSTVGNLGLGAAAGTLASTVCYPLDTVRRRMQMRGRTYAGQVDAFRTIWRTVRRRTSPASLGSARLGASLSLSLCLA